MRVESFKRSIVAAALLVGCQCLLTSTATAATVYGNLRRANFTYPVNEITFTPTNSPFQNADGQVIVSEQVKTRPTNGYFSVNIEQGYYTSNFGAALKDTKKIYVPAGTGSYDFWSLITTNGPTFASEIPGGPVFNATNATSATGVSPFKRKVGQILEFYNFVGAGGATVTQTTSNIVITASAGGSGGDIEDDGTGDDFLDGH